MPLMVAPTSPTALAGHLQSHPVIRHGHRAHVGQWIPPGVFRAPIRLVPPGSPEAVAELEHQFVGWIGGIDVHVTKYRVALVQRESRCGRIEIVLVNSRSVNIGGFVAQTSPSVSAGKPTAGPGN